MVTGQSRYIPHHPPP
ncbi:hypothetical protein LINPERPRIM_LOCUS4240 [Linum perenne]